MKYAQIDSQGHMIFEDNYAQKDGQPIPSNYVVRRLSDVKISPDIVQVVAQGIQANTDIHYGQQPVAGNQNIATTAPVKGVINLDDGLIDEELNSVPYTDDIQYDQATKTLGAVTDLTQQTDPEQKVAGDAKTPLLKPKTPPKLPNWSGSFGGLIVRDLFRLKIIYHEIDC